jgi:hypothetical protein
MHARWNEAINLSRAILQKIFDFQSNMREEARLERCG